MKITKMFRTLPQRLMASAFVALAVLLPVAKTAADAVTIGGSVGVGNVTTGEAQFGARTTASEGQTVKVQVYYKNQEAVDSGKVANNVRVAVNIPAAAGAEQTITTSVVGDNTNAVNGSVSVGLANPTAHLEYIPGSALWRHSVNGQAIDSVVSDAVATSGGFVLEGQTAAGSESSLTVLARVVAAVQPPVVETPVATPKVAPETPVEAVVAETARTTTAVSSSVGQVGSAPRCTVYVSGDRGQAFSVANNVATITFKVDGASGCKVQVSANSFYAPSMDGRPYDQQILYERNTQTFTPGTYTMTVHLPAKSTPEKGCYYQVDLTYGTYNVTPVLAYGHGTLDCTKPELACKSLTASPVANTRRVDFVATATAAGTTVSNYRFVFGDGSQQTVNTASLSANASHEYAEWGKQYTAQVYVTSTDLANVTSATCMVSFETAKQPSVVIEKSVSKAVVKVNETFTYTVKVTNNGQTPLTNVKVTDPSPLNVQFLSASAGTVESNGLFWSHTIPTLAVGESKTYTITAKVTKYVPDQILNTACVNAPEVNPSEPTKPDDCDDAPVNVQEPNPSVAIEKTVSKAQVRVGEQFTYTLKVINNGDEDLTNVKVSDPARPNVKFLSASAGTVNATGTLWTDTIASLPVGQSKTYTITAVVTAYVEGQVMNNACVDAPEVPGAPDDCDEVPVVVIKDNPNISVEKTVSKDSVDVGEDFTYTVKVTNTGDVALTNVAVRDQAPANVKFLSASAGTVNATGTLWTHTIPTLAVGESQTFSVVAEVTAYVSGQIVNTVCVDAPQMPASPDDCDDVPVTVIKHNPKVEIVKEVSQSSVKVGEDFVYTLTVKNTGDVTLTNVKVSDPARPNIKFLSASAGTVNATGTLWTHTIPTLAVGESQTFTITAEVTKYVSGEVVNVACVDAPEVPGAPDDCDDAPVLVTQENPSVLIEKSVSKPQVQVGEEFAYLVKVTNNGDVALTNVVVADSAPQNVTFVDASEGVVTASKWSHTIPTLAVGESKTYTITAKVTKYVPDQILNTACVNAPEVNPSEPTKPDDCDDAPVNVVKPVVPVYSCDLLTLSTAKGRMVTATVSYTAANATLKSVVFDFGDGSRVTTNSTTKTHQYANDGTYTVTARLLFNVNGVDVYAADSERCAQKVQITTPSEPGVVLSRNTNRPSVLPNTGASGLVLIAGTVSLLAGLGHYFLLGNRRRTE